MLLWFSSRPVKLAICSLLPITWWAIWCRPISVWDGQKYRCPKAFTLGTPGSLFLASADGWKFCLKITKRTNSRNGNCLDQKSVTTKPHKTLDQFEFSTYMALSVQHMSQSVAGDLVRQRHGGLQGGLPRRQDQVTFDNPFGDRNHKLFKESQQTWPQSAISILIPTVYTEKFQMDGFLLG